MVYAHSEEGTALFGRKDQLVDDVIAGKEVKVSGLRVPLISHLD